MTTLDEACVHYVARELARPLVKDDGGWQAWGDETKRQRSNAILKIAKMTNMQLLELIGEVMQNGWKPNED